MVVDIQTRSVSGGKQIIGLGFEDGHRVEPCARVYQARARGGGVGLMNLSLVSPDLGAANARGARRWNTFVRACGVSCGR